MVTAGFGEHSRVSAQFRGERLLNGVGTFDNVEDVGVHNHYLFFSVLTYFSKEHLEETSVLFWIPMNFH